MPKMDTAAIAAVSIRRIVGPSLVGSQPAANKLATSDSVKPPSGPTAIATG